MQVILNQRQLNTARQIIANGGSSTYRAFGNVIPGRDLSSLLGTSRLLSTKQDFTFDFGYKDDVDFYDLYELYKRNGVAKAVVNKTIGKTWQTNPALKIGQEEHEETPVEAEIRKKFQQIRFWQGLQETDKRSLVGEYAGVIFRFADGKRFDEPVERVTGGLEGLTGIIPAWEGQLQISQWDQDRDSPTYGEPIMMTFTESSVDPDQGKTRAFYVHPSRVYIWSQDRTTFNDSDMEASYNALVDMVKIRGSGAEGFWKNAKSQPVLEADKDVNFGQLAQMLGTDITGLPEALDNIVADWNKGFDQSLVLQGMTANTLGVTLPQPKEFYDIASMEVAANWNIPHKVLFGNVVGERASTEDLKEWSLFNMSRRNNYVIPNIMDIVDKLIEVGVLIAQDWALDWEDLTGSTMGEKLELAKGQSQINRDAAATGEVVFTDDEIRETLGYESTDDLGLTELEDNGTE